MKLETAVVNTTIKGLTSILCRVNADQLSEVPSAGPLIIISNHINFLDVPVLYTRLLPRPITGFAKIETWDSRPMAYLFSLWEAIPIRRGQADTNAMRLGLEALRAGKILAIAPEGTRSGHGKLNQGQPGVVTVALRSNAPLLPIVYYGNEAFSSNIRRLKRTDFHIRVGKPFKINTFGQKVTHQVRHQIIDEIMYQLAAMLPPEYRGCYSNLSARSTTYLDFT